MDALELSDLLDQSDYWINQRGDRIPLQEIDARYAGNIMRMLQRNAPAWKSAVEMIYVLAPGPNGDMAQDAFDAEFNGLLRTRPAKWMQSQRLYRAIQRRTSR